MARERLGELLIKAGLLDEAGLNRALSEQRRWGGPLGRYLVDLGLITEETLVRGLSTQCRVPAVAIEPHRLDHQVARKLPQELCEKHRMICFGVDEQKRFIDVAMADPLSAETIDEIRVRTRYNVRPYFAAPSAINDAIAQVFYGEGSAIGGTIDIESGQPTAAPARAAGAAAGASRAPQPPGPGFKVDVGRGTAPAPPQPRAEQILPPPVSLPPAHDDVSGRGPPPSRDADGRHSPGTARTQPPSSTNRRFDDGDGDDHTVRRARPSDSQMALEAHVARQGQVIALLLSALVKSRVLSPDKAEELERLLRGD